MLRLILAVALICSSRAAPVDVVHKYNGDQVIQVHPQNAGELRTLQTLHDNYALGLDFWVRPNLHVPVDIHVPRAEVNTVQSILNKASIKYEIKVEDLQSLIDAERAEIEMREKLSAAHPDADDANVCPWWYPNCNGVVGPGTVDPGKPKTGNSKSQDSVVGTWISHTEVNNFLGRMQANEGSRVSVSSIGNSYEGRDMRMIKITSGNGRAKPGVFIESTIHAREWLTQGTTNYLIDKLVREYNTNADVTAMLDGFDFYILPVANPDGYEYTRNSVRLWRKTRSRNSGTNCIGTDPNRNFDFHWRESGTSSDPCSDTYGGPSAFSEVETRNIRDAVQGLNDVQLYFDMHSYSQLWMTPWAYGRAKPSDNTEMVRVANIARDALRSTHGTYFQVGAPPDILYAASGGSYDWAKGVAGIKYAYALELRPSGSAWNGFVVSESTIVPSGEEVFAGLHATCQEILKARSG